MSDQIEKEQVDSVTPYHLGRLHNISEVFPDENIEKEQNVARVSSGDLGQLSPNSEMSSDTNIEKEQNVCSIRPGPIGNLSGLGEVSSAINILGGFGGAFKMAYGSEGRVEIKITNKLNDDIEIQLNGGKKKYPKEILESGMTRIFSKKSRDGLGHTTYYQCEFWFQNKHACVYVYGERAPRKDNLIEVRDNGFFLIEQTNEFQVSKWDQDHCNCKCNQ